MKRLLLAGIAATAVLAGSQAMAQETIVIEPQQRTVIKEFVVKERVRPVTVRERLAVGAVVPADVELAAVPETWGPRLRSYRYIYSDNHVFLVEPSSRRVVHVID